MPHEDVSLPTWRRVDGKDYFAKSHICPCLAGDMSGIQTQVHAAEKHPTKETIWGHVQGLVKVIRIIWLEKCKSFSPGPDIMSVILLYYLDFLHHTKCLNLHRHAFQLCALGRRYSLGKFEPHRMIYRSDISNAKLRTGCSDWLRRRQCPAGRRKSCPGRDG